MSDTGAYRFDELGSRQFADLCLQLLQSDGDGWHEYDYGRVRQFEHAAAAPALAADLVFPVLVVIAWLRYEEAPHRDVGWLVAGQVASAPGACSVLVLTNASEPSPSPPMPTPIEFLGAGRLSELIDADPALRMRVPAVLGVRDLAPLMAPETVERSTLDLAAATELARVFVATGAYRRTLDVLAQRRFAVVTGPPEMGKTAIARTVALARMVMGWEAHECIRPEQLWAAFDRERPQVFVADDAFGSTEYRPDAAERWALDLPRILQAMDDRHWLIWTSRPAPLRAGLRRIHREHGLERFPQPAEAQVDATQLTVAEKALILFRHAKAPGLSPAAIEIVQRHGWEIVRHAHFTPERIRRFVGGRLPELAAVGRAPAQVAAAVNAEIREPTAAMAASFAALAPEHRALLVALLDTPPGPVSERELTASLRRHARSETAHAVPELVDRLTDHFLRVVGPSSVAWVHPSWRDLVIALVADDRHLRARFLERAGLEGVLLALSTGGGAAGERVLPLLIDDADWDAVTARVASLVVEVPAPSAIRLLGALEATIAWGLPSRRRAEAVALTTYALARIAERWDAESAALAPAALAAWFAAAGELVAPPRAPLLDRTWVELVPGDRVDVDAPADVARFDEWLALVEVMQGFARDDLARFGFPLEFHQVINRFVHGAAFAAPGNEELLTQVLARIERVTPGHAFEARVSSIELLAEDREGWFDVRFPQRVARVESPVGDRELVDRLLGEL